MTRTLSADDEHLIAQLYERLCTTLRFFQDAQDFDSSPFLAQVQKAYEGQNLRAMRLMARDVDQMTMGLTPDQRDGLEALLHSRLGIDADVEREELGRKVTKVIERGAVASEKERRHLEDYAEMLEATGGDARLIEAVRRILAAG